MRPRIVEELTPQTLEEPLDLVNCRVEIWKPEIAVEM